MRSTTLGPDGPEVGVIGLGCMGMSFGYDLATPRDEAELISVIHQALDLGMTLLDTSDVYGPYTNEELVGRALADGHRERAVLATKVGVLARDGAVTGLNGRPEHIRRSIDESLGRLGTAAVLLTCHVFQCGSPGTAEVRHATARGALVTALNTAAWPSAVCHPANPPVKLEVADEPPGPRVLARPRACRGERGDEPRRPARPLADHDDAAPRDLVSRRPAARTTSVRTKETDPWRRRGPTTSSTGSVRRRNW
ncbi:aldo/keto reductase [Streptomyces sp. NPDC088253]|uniref:aldo/keto reductase n=1 Tax=Streptomyces sp. NPDC088253 TaxID=3365846 RepID=UPI003820D3F5